MVSAVCVDKENKEDTAGTLGHAECAWRQDARLAPGTRCGQRLNLSGGRVFKSYSWEVIALNHKGGKMGTPMLNDRAGTYAANEGISIHSIIEAIATRAH